ncbi:hypothetical protein KUCAC02_012654, partial [Chaenocephalus aceratus]
ELQLQRDPLLCGEQDAGEEPRQRLPAVQPQGPEPHLPKGPEGGVLQLRPYPLWAGGCHMVALNIQTADKYTQLNSALFSMNGQTGYVLQPELMRYDSYDPNQEKKKVKYEIAVRVIAARHLPKPGRSIVSPFVEIELCGHTDEKFKTLVYRDNGLNPCGSPRLTQRCSRCFEPELTFLRFVVNEEDMFSDPNFVAQATFPVKGIAQGTARPSEERLQRKLGVSLSAESGGGVVLVLQPAEEEAGGGGGASPSCTKHTPTSSAPALPHQHTLLAREGSTQRTKEKKINNSKFYS